MFLPNRVRVGNQEIPFRELVWQAYMGARLALGDRLLQDAQDPLGPRASGRGRPFYYFAYGAAAARSRSTR